MQSSMRGCLLPAHCPGPALGPTWPPSKVLCSWLAPKHPPSPVLAGEQGRFSRAWEPTPTAVSTMQARCAQMRKTSGDHAVGVPGAVWGYIVRAGSWSTSRTAPGHEGAAPAPGSPSSSSSSQELLPWQLQGPPALCQQHDAMWTLSHGASFSPHPGLVQTPLFLGLTTPPLDRAALPLPSLASGPFPASADPQQLLPREATSVAGGPAHGATGGRWPVCAHRTEVPGHWCQQGPMGWA